MSYSDSLKGPEKERYERKLQCLYGVTGRSSKEKCVEVLDPYHISVELSWPPIEFPHVFDRHSWRIHQGKAEGF